MRKLITGTIGMLMVLMIAGTAAAVDIRTLDRVSVLMPKTGVLALLGAPEEVMTLGMGLEAEIYRVSDMDPMVGVGCIYEDDQRLVGLAYVFRSEMEKEAVVQLRQLGFTVLDEEGGACRLLGKDDDTGQPLVVIVSIDNGMTIFTSFEKGFYDRRVK